MRTGNDRRKAREPVEVPVNEPVETIPMDDMDEEQMQEQAREPEQANSFAIDPKQQVTILCGNALLFSGTGVTEISLEKQ